MNPTNPMSIVDSEESLFLDGSTAPTTPEGSLSFSPVLRARSYADGLDAASATDGAESSAGSGISAFGTSGGGLMAAKSRNGSRSLSSTLLDSTARSGPVRNICCVGAGYVGGPTAAMIAYQNPNIRVTVVDKDVSRIRRWNSSHLPIFEPGLREIVRIARDGSREFVFANEPASNKHRSGLHGAVSGVLGLSGSSATSDAGGVEGVSSGGLYDGGGSGASASTSESECESQCGRDDGDVVVDDEGRVVVLGRLGGTGGPMTVPGRVPNLFFTTAVSKCISEADIVLVAVNTPTKKRGAGAGSATDMTAFEAVTAEVAMHARPGAIIVEKSTVPCRTAQMVADTLSTHRKGVHFEILSNPEFLAAGTAMSDLLLPDRVLIGCSPTASGRRAADALASVYASWVPRSRILTTNVFSSELAKLVANSMLAQRISSINSIAAVCEATGADVDEVAAAIGCDPRIGSKFLKAGIGFGGSCFKKDILSLVYLAESLGLEQVGAYWRAVVDMNSYARDRFAQRVVACLNNTLAGKKLTLLGYAFKNNTSDTRETPALDIIRTLLEEGPREIAVYDPCCNPVLVREELNKLLADLSPVLREKGGPVVVYANPYDACREADAVLVTTEWDEFRNAPTSAAAAGKVTTAAGPSSAQRAAANKANPGAAHSQRQQASAPSNAKPALQDPRPFERLDPTETDLLALHRFLAAERKRGTKLGGANDKSAEGVVDEDPLQRFEREPACAPECPDCKLGIPAGGDGGSVPTTTTTGSTPGATTEYTPNRERLDWSRVAYHLRKPKWVFDGKGLIDVREMAKMGVRVESVGRQRR